MPVERTVPIRETVPIQTTVPVTREVEVTKTVPVVKNITTTENFQVRQQVPVQETKTITKEVPILKTQQVTENVMVQEFPKKDFVITEIPVKEKVVTKEVTVGQPTILTGTVLNNYSQTISNSPQSMYDPNLGINTAYKGVPTCTECQGLGYLKSRLDKDRIVPCSNCVKQTGNCCVCNNTGKRIDNLKYCSCMYAEELAKQKVHT